MRPTPSYGRRAASYWFIDGLPEILFGLVLVVTAIAVVLWRLHAPIPWRKHDMVVALAGFLVYYFNERKILDFLKSRLTYPRTGYVEPPEELEGHVPTLTTLGLQSPPAKENVTHFRNRIVGPISVLYFFFMVNGDPMGRWLAPVAMPVLAATMFGMSRRSERPYRWWSALILALSGPLFLLVDVPMDLNRSLPLMLVGVWLLAEGAYSLLRYLRENPSPRTGEGVRA